ncbi:MAG TPA: prepilin-type N-terminal cleavage/methylation domain-containing protein [Gemmataceae bacterium]|nr:prepilin-type N-terminal cleavage/methylation domain-containing protein [Gemmataceae bacterium]
MTLHRRTNRRPGLSLLEVLVALAIFLVGMVVLGQMINLASEQALQVRQQGQAAQLCQSKLAEISAGAIPLSSEGETPFEEDPSWVWSIQAEPAEIPNLWRVSVRVSRAGAAEGVGVECVMSQLVLDPAVRGSALDMPSAPSAADSGGSSSSGSSSASSGGGQGSGGGQRSGGGQGSGGGQRSGGSPGGGSPGRGGAGPAAGPSPSPGSGRPPSGPSTPPSVPSAPSIPSGPPRIGPSGPPTGGSLGPGTGTRGGRP